MQHCCKFSPDEVYFLCDNDNFSKRKLSIGTCPICSKPIAEMVQTKFDGQVEKFTLSGFKANRFVQNLKNEISYSAGSVNYTRFKAKPFGWKYGENKVVKINGEERIKQYACDFYGNKEVIKTL